MDVGTGHVPLAGIQVLAGTLLADEIGPANRHRRGIPVALDHGRGRKPLFVVGVAVAYSFRALCGKQALFPIIGILERGTVHLRHSGQQVVLAVVEAVLLPGLLRRVQVALAVVGIAGAIVLHQLDVREISRVHLVRIEHIEVDRVVGTCGHGVFVIGGDDTADILPALPICVTVDQLPLGIAAVINNRCTDLEPLFRNRVRFHVTAEAVHITFLTGCINGMDCILFQGRITGQLQAGSLLRIRCHTVAGLGILDSPVFCRSSASPCKAGVIDHVITVCPASFLQLETVEPDGAGRLPHQTVNLHGLRAGNGKGHFQTFPAAVDVRIAGSGEGFCSQGRCGASGRQDSKNGSQSAGCRDNLLCIRVSGKGIGTGFQ